MVKKFTIGSLCPKAEKIFEKRETMELQKRFRENNENFWCLSLDSSSETRFV